MIPYRDNVQIERPPIVTYTIIGICTVIALLQPFGNEQQMLEFYERWGLIPRGFTDPRWARIHGHPLWWTPLTHMFLHDGLVHFLGNMIYLGVFGRAVEDRMGHWRYALFYLVGGLVAGATHVIIESNADGPLVGASGAISAVMGAHLLMFTQARVKLFPLVFVWIPSWVALGVWFFFGFLGGLMRSSLPFSIGGVAEWAHVGGFIFGALFCHVILIGRAWRWDQPYAEEH